jgi:hypothetical protein
MQKGPASAEPSVRKYLILFGRDGEIRTRDPLNPIQVRYQAALRPDMGIFSHGVSNDN